MLNYYETTVDRPEFAQLQGRSSTDICIIGGGLAGMSTAIGLVERGISNVAVLDAQRVGYGASGRNGGFVFGGYSLDCADLVKTLGPQQARDVYGLTIKAIALMRERIRRYRIDCDAVYAGVILANWFEDMQPLEQQRRLMKESFGVEWEVLGKSELAAQLKTDRYHGGVLEPNAFHFHPLKYVCGIAKAAQEGGARIYENSPVISIRKNGAAFEITTTNGVLDAREVVFAGGGYAHGIYRPVERAILPIATYVMTTEPLGSRLRDVIDCQAAIYDTRFAFDYYRPLPDTRILWGGRISILERNHDAIAQLLRRDLLKVYPQLSDVRIDHAWGGLMSYARHKMPVIGRNQDGVWYASGFGGHGMAPTTVSGELLAAAITDEQPIPAALNEFGLVPAFGRAGLAAAQFTYWTLQMRDALNA